MNYPLVLSKEDMDVIAAGLGELPLKVSAQVFGRLQAQCKAFEESQAKDKQSGDGDRSEA